MRLQITLEWTENRFAIWRLLRAMMKTIEVMKLFNVCVHVCNLDRKIEPTIDNIQKEVCKFYDIPFSLLKLPTRKREIVLARQISMKLSKDNTKFSSSYIGQKTGNKDHATCLHAIKTVNNLYETDKFFRKDFDELEAKFKSIR